MNYEHDGWNHNVSTCQPYIKAYLSLAEKKTNKCSCLSREEERLLRTFTS